MTKPKLLHPALFAVAPVLFLYSHNMEELPFSAIVMPAFVILLVSLALWWALGRTTKDPVKAGLTVSLLVVWFFTYGHLYSSFSTSFAWTLGIPLRHRYFIPVWTTLFAYVIYLVWKTRRRLHGLTGALNVVAAVPVALALGQVVLFQVSGRARLPAAMASSNSSLPPATAVPANELPDIYYIILDAYANQHVLRKMFGYSNHEFLDALKQRGFYVAERSRSNYAMTFTSMASSLNMEYLDEPAQKAGRESRDLLPLRQMIKYNKVARFLRERGYTYIDLNSPTDLALNDFQHTLLRTTILRYQQDLDYFRNRTLALFDQLAELPRKDQPVFVYAHVICPHPPYVFGPDGEQTDDPGTQLTVSDPGKHKRLYVDQLRYVSKRALGAIDTILARSKRPPIIILQSDHGPGVVGDILNPNDVSHRERMPILNAYYLPGGGAVRPYAGITPVNTFRLIFNRYFGSGYPLLKDRSYFSTYYQPYDFLDVTDKAISAAQ
jgi:hypothetical protein